MSHTKLGPTLTAVDNDKHETHSFWFENFKCSVRVDRRKDGHALAVTLKTPDGKVVVSLGPEERPRFVTQVRYATKWTDASEYSCKIDSQGVKFTFLHDPPA